MENKIKFPKKILLLVSVAGVAMFIGSIIGIDYGRFNNWRLWGMTACSIVTAIFCIIDVIKNQKARKVFWVISFIVFGCLATFVYLLQRKEDEQ